MKEKLRVIDIEQMNDIKYDEIHEGDSSLSHWYNSIRNVWISQLSVGDLARLIRQDMFLEYIVNESIERLVKDPLLGDQFDGELIESLSKKQVNNFREIMIGIKKSIKELLISIKTSNFIDEYDWLIDDDKTGFIKAVEQLSKNVE